MAAFKFKRGDKIRDTSQVLSDLTVRVRRTYVSDGAAYYLLDNGHNVYECERELIEPFYALVPQESKS
jgi:hypothetical protein